MYKELLIKWLLVKKLKQWIKKLGKTKLNTIYIDKQLRSSENVGKYISLTCKDVLQEKDMLEKASAMKIFENLL